MLPLAQEQMLGANISAVAIPEGASHFLVYSANSFGEMIVPFSAPIQDMYVWNLLCWLSDVKCASSTGMRVANQGIVRQAGKLPSMLQTTMGKRDRSVSCRESRQTRWDKLEASDTFDSASTMVNTWHIWEEDMREIWNIINIL